MLVGWYSLPGLKRLTKNGWENSKSLDYFCGDRFYFGNGNVWIVLPMPLPPALAALYGVDLDAIRSGH